MLVLTIPNRGLLYWKSSNPFTIPPRRSYHVPVNIGPNVLSWLPAEQIEESAMRQIENLSQMPFIFRHVAVMPDCHFGLGATVGSVIPTLRAIIPAAVGVDIGCGMIAVKTPLKRDDLPDELSDIRRGHREPDTSQRRPLQPQRQENGSPAHRAAGGQAAELDRLDFYDNLSKNWRNQLGSLGSGNHFIEIVLDEETTPGPFFTPARAASAPRRHPPHRHRQAVMEKWYIDLPDADLSYLVEDTPEFDDYMTDLDWAQEFALLNREEMMERIIKILQHRCGDFEEVERIQCHHNFTKREHHFGRNILVSARARSRPARVSSA